ncbi:50S ribosomal protein L25 [Candidatus Peregrinibacteria bacterium]|nr:50S ribosomal protein L25 [Candidatus Peregrinibacteria bacterium]
MDIVALDVSSRDKTKKAKDLLAENLIPAEYYGSGVENKSVQIDYQTFRRAFIKAGTNTVIKLNIDGKEGPDVLVHEVQYNPTTDKIAHIDFINVRMDKEIEAEIPLVFVGVAPAVKELGGSFTSQLDEISIKCLPKDLIHNIEVSIEPLVDFHTYIRVKDLNIPKGITVLHNPEDVVAAVSAPRAEEVEVKAEVAASVEGEAGAVPVEGAASAESAEKKEK